MPLSWNDIRNNAIAFSHEWADVSSEDAEAKSFWDAFFKVFGVHRRRVATFEEPVKKNDGKGGFIDLLWKGVVLVEHKSRGKDLDRAFTQATDYFPGIKDADLPQYVIVSDFARLRLYDLETGKHHEFKVAALHDNIKRFGFLAGYQTQTYKEEDDANIKAAERMGALYERLRDVGYTGHPLQVFLVRLMFCMFAEDTGIFPKNHFTDYLKQHTKDDGADLASSLAEIFQVLNTPEEKHAKNLDEDLALFPYVNGRLFEEHLPIASFDRKMRDALLECCGVNWSRVSPAIFGAMFQSVMDDKARRALGAHYTSEKNILKVIHPLFLDDLRAEFERIKTNRNKLFEFHKKLRTLTFFDPACGCGNFLVIAYRELRLLELDVLRAARKSSQLLLDVHSLINLDVDQFYGIEIEEFPAQIAQVALWMVDHQMNMKVSDEFGMYFARIPLKTTPHIVNDNALRLDWSTVLPAERCSYLFGNPPFVGAKLLDDGQRADVQAVFSGLDGGGLLDFVAAWYVKAARYIQAATPCAFVSTSSITQGEQVGVLWGWLLSQGIKIRFAHRTFRWRNEARGVAAVHCVIIGFGRAEARKKVIYDYADVAGEPHAVEASNINPYLVDAADILLTNRENPICQVLTIGIGNKPIDGGHYLFTPEEKDDFLKLEPRAARWFRRWIGSEEFINGTERWCLWLGDCPPDQLRQMPQAMKRVNAVRAFRLGEATNKKGKERKKAPPESTQKLAATPTRFHVENIPDSPYLVIPEVSSENRLFIPIGYLQPDTLASNLVKIAPHATLFDFGVLTSTMHMAWVRAVCGRLESRYRYSVGIVYNNFPWPVSATDKQREAVSAGAQAVLDTRASYPKASLADLYDPGSMPSELVKAHQALDRALDTAYVASGGKKAWSSDAERVAFLFEMYQKLTSLLPTGKPKKVRKKAA
jgi:hypothetical protein